MQTRKQRGNTFFYVLLFTGLFALLTFTLTQTGRDSASAIKEKQLIDAAVLVQYATTVSSVIRTLMANGIDPADIDFVVPGAGGFTVAPHTKKVFHPQGGGAGYMSNAGSLADFVYSKNSDIDGIGTTGVDDFLFVAEVEADTCRMLNLHHTGSDDVPVMDVTQFTALLAGNSTTVNAAACSSCVGVKFMCVKSAANSRNLYYHVLLDQ